MSELFTDQLRRAINNCGMSHYALCQATRIDKAVLSRFMSGKRGLSLESLDKLIDVMGLTLTPKRRRRRGAVE
jgi:hypothetical protein